MNTRVRWGWLIVAVLGLGAVPAWAQAPLLVTQGAFSADVVPLEGDGSAAALYAYEGSRAHSGLEQNGRSLLFFYREGGALSLVILHGPPALEVTNSTGLVRFTLRGLPATSRLELVDDPEDQVEFTPPLARLRWKWHTGRTDGVVIGGLGEDFTLELAPQFIQGITRWAVLSQGPDGVEVIPLPSLERPVRVAMGAAAGRGARAAFEISAPGGTPRALSPVTFDAGSSLAPTGSRLVRYEWDFDGDGLFEQHSDAPAITHTFPRSGAFTVTLRVTASDGTTAQASQTVPVIATPAVRATRQISTPTALPGSTFRVTLSLTIERDLNGLGVEERWPAGWTLSAVRSDGAAFKARSRQWVFAKALKAGQTKTLVYDVHVPPGEQLGRLPRTFEVYGTLTSRAPALGTVVEGERAVEVASCLSTPVALAHLDLETNGIDLRLPERLTASQVTHARNLWLAGQGLPAACTRTVTLEALQQVRWYHALERPVDRPLPQAGAQAGVRARRTLITPLPGHLLYAEVPDGNRFRVELEVTALRPLDSVGLTEFLPYGWRVEPLPDPEVLYQPEETQWLWLTPWQPGETRTLIYEVTVPRDGPTRAAVVRGAVQTPDSPFAEIVTGDRAVELVHCLPVLVAIAHWDVDRNAIDLSLDHAIHPLQALAAFDLWLDDAPVPGTCGQRLDFDTLQLVTRYSVEGVPVDQPLD